MWRYRRQQFTFSFLTLLKFLRDFTREPWDRDTVEFLGRIQSDKYFSYVMIFSAVMNFLHWYPVSLCVRYISLSQRAFLIFWCSLSFDVYKWILVTECVVRIPGEDSVTGARCESWLNIRVRFQMVRRRILSDEW